MIRGGVLRRLPCRSRWGGPVVVIIIGFGLVCEVFERERDEVSKIML